MSPVVVCGATGRVGSLVVEELLSRGVQVRATGRPGAKLEALGRRGAIACPGSLHDRAFLRQVLAGAEAAFLMTPVDTSAEDVNGVQFSIIDAVTDALTGSGVRHAVLLSSWGAELEQQVGGIIACHRFERALEAIDGLNVVHLRPTWFMDNFLWSIPLIQIAGINGSAMDGTFSFPMIAARDIAPIAVGYLLERTFVGSQVHYLCGPRDQNLVEVTRAIAEAIGKEDLGYVRLPDDVYRRGLLGAGLTPNAAELAMDIGRGIEGRVVRAEPRTTSNSTPTTIQAFAREIFLPSYRASPPPSFGARLNGTFLRGYLTIRGCRPQ